MSTQETERTAAVSPQLPSEELPRDACLGIIAHLLAQSSQRDESLEWHYRRDLLLRDYASRSASLSAPTRSRLDRVVIEALSDGRNQAQLFQAVSELPTEARVDVAIVTILPEELKATLAAFNVQEIPQAAQPFYSAEVACRGRPSRSLNVIITSAPGPLNVPVATTVFTLRSLYSPSAVFLVGIAGGRAGKVSRGDVIIAQRILYWEPGRVTPTDVEPRPQVEEPRNPYGSGLYSYDPDGTSFRMLVSEFIANLPDYRHLGLAPGFIPTVHRDNITIASGEKVLRDGALLEDLAQRFDGRIRAVDQESYGFAFAVRDLPWAIFRGISDLADERQDDRWRYAAAGFASICIRDFLESYYVPPDVAEL